MISKNFNDKVKSSLCATATKLKLFAIAFSFSAVASVSFTSDSVAEDKFITIGTGSVTGVYYPAGGAICRLVNRTRKDHGIRCSVESTGGSVYNLNAIRNGELDVAVAQSDWQYHSFQGTGPNFEKLGPDANLRSLFSLHSEPFTVIARTDANIKTINDLVGKRVNIGNPGSGQRATMDMIMMLKGWDKSTFKLASELKASEQAQALCDNKIDVMIYAVGHPNGAVQEVTTTCDANIVQVADEDVDSLVEGFPFYTYTIIPGGMYNGNDNDVKTFGVRATFVSSAKVPTDTVYNLVKAVFDNFDNFITLHPVFSTLNKQDMVNLGNTAPLHDGAIKYYKEVGLLGADGTANKAKTKASLASSAIEDSLSKVGEN